MMVRIQHNWTSTGWLAPLRYYPILGWGRVGHPTLVPAANILLTPHWKQIGQPWGGVVHNVELLNDFILDTKHTLFFSLLSRGWSDCGKRLTNIHKESHFVHPIIESLPHQGGLFINICIGTKVLPF